MSKQTKITRSARNEDCALRIPGICNFDPDTVVFCHAPCVDKGMGYKSPDWWGAYGCSDCHDVVDSRVAWHKMDWAFADIWLPAIYETQKKLIAKGLITIEGRK